MFLLLISTRNCEKTKETNNRIPLRPLWMLANPIYWAQSCTHVFTTRYSVPTFRHCFMPNGLLDHKTVVADCYLRRKHLLCLVIASYAFLLWKCQINSAVEGVTVLCSRTSLNADLMHIHAYIKLASYCRSKLLVFAEGVRKKRAIRSELMLPKIYQNN